MGLVYATIDLINAVDVVDAKRQMIGEEEIRRTRVNMLVDSGAYMLCINENIQAYLQLPVKRRDRCQIADGRWVVCDVVGPVDVEFENRKATCNAYVLPGDSEPLLGAIPLEELDVIIHAARQELIINPLHPEGAVLRI
ncbi:MAG: retroviral-like aspartic protease [Bacteroidetes bacterium]|nr:retroviral-like aspartic protease [Bacteroidota bacterium]